MGYWFGRSSSCYPWRKTPTKIGNTWYTPYGEVVRDPDAYFAAIRRNGRYWEDDTGWDEDSYNSCDYDDDYDDDDYDDDDYDDDDDCRCYCCCDRY